MSNMSVSETAAFQNISLSYWGYFTPFGGYGIANFNWVKHLLRKGVKVYPHAKFMPARDSKEWNILNEEERYIALLPYQRMKVGIIETTPYDFHLIDNEIKIANTMIENDMVCEPWKQQCKRMNHIIVPNNFQKRCFEEAGFRNVVVIPHGTEVEKFPYYDRPKREVFTFGIVGWLNDRKGVFEVVRAFASEFDKNEPVRLILKSSNLAFGYFSNWQDNRIRTINRLVSPTDLNRLYQEMDCFVFPSKAEGVGQPPREAMATGLPVILTNWSGLEELCKVEISFPLQVKKLVKGANPQVIEQPGNWAEIDIAELMYWMRYVYEHQDEAKEKGKKAADFIRQEFSWEKCACRLATFVSLL